MSWIPVNDRKHWIERLIEISNEMDESESLGSMSSRVQNSKRSPDYRLTIRSVTMRTQALMKIIFKMKL